MKLQNISEALDLFKQIQNIMPDYKDTKALIEQYQELNQNKNLQIYLIANQSDFILLCKQIVSLGNVYGNGDTRSVSFPISADIFKAQGGGLNFVHGGCSPQEMIIPLIDVKTEKSKVETTFAEISMTTNISKITNLSVNLEFFQRQPVSDVVKPATYHIYFEAEDGERVSNENQYHADSAESNPLNTKAKLRFSFKNRIYSNKDKYYLIIMDEEHNIQLAKIPFTIDIAMANDFGF